MQAMSGQRGRPRGQERGQSSSTAGDPMPFGGEWQQEMAEMRSALAKMMWTVQTLVADRDQGEGQD